MFVIVREQDTLERSPLLSFAFEGHFCSATSMKKALLKNSLPENKEKEEKEAVENERSEKGVVNGGRREKVLVFGIT